MSFLMYYVFTSDKIKVMRTGSEAAFSIWPLCEPQLLEQCSFPSGLPLSWPTVFITRWSAMCNTLATCHEAKLKSVSIITVRASTQVSVLECADVLAAEVSPRYSPTSLQAVFSSKSQAMDRAEQVTESLVEEGRLPAKKGTVNTQFSNFPIFIWSSFFVPFA